MRRWRKFARRSYEALFAAVCSRRASFRTATIRAHKGAELVSFEILP
jgi:hypothetical protein